MQDLLSLSAKEQSQLVQSKQISVAELVKCHLDFIGHKDQEICAFLDIRKEQALKEANLLDENIAKGDFAFGPLTGVPIAVKDNICLKGEKVTCASKMLSNFVSSFEATVVSKLKQSGLIIVGKTNMDEFAMGSSTENSALQITKNPCDLSTVPGGSSGGSAAAVAAGMVPLSLGSDTGGSIRQPAAFCGVLGFKPTYGMVSRYGLIAFASSLDQIGPFARSVEDLHLLLATISGFDKHDSTSTKKELANFDQALPKGLTGLKVAVPKELMGQGVSLEVKESILSTLKTLSEQGVIVEEISLPSFAYALSSYYIIAPAEASANLARFDGVKYGHRSTKQGSLSEMYFHSRNEGFGLEVKRRILIGTYVLSAGYYDAYYLKAQKVRTLILEDFNQALAKYDFILTPTAPTVAFKIGEKTADPLAMYLNDIATIPVNLAGLPAISIPCPNVKGDMPVGLQIIGKAFADTDVLKFAYLLQEKGASN